MTPERALVALVLVHAGATCAMVGLIWFVQIVHYPLMARVGVAQFAGYEAAHTARTTRVVMPLMLVELATSIAIVAMRERLGVGAAPAFAGLALLGVIWCSTFAVQVPAHARLARGFCVRTHRRLVRTNWVRTFAWTTRGVLAGWVLVTCRGLGG